MKKNKGITLIALVITIIILIILAGVSINLVFGQTGIITRAKEAKEATRAASVEDERNLWISEVELGQTLSENYKSLDEILGELIENNANFIQDKNKEVEYANEIIGSKDIILIEKVIDDGEKWCFETLDFDPVIDTELMIIDKNVSDLVNFNNIEADDIEVIDFVR